MEKLLNESQEFNNALKLNEKPTTFMVKIVYSKNQTIQGYIHWLETEKSIPFRSFMEMIHLVNEAIDNSQEMQFRSWENPRK